MRCASAVSVTSRSSWVSAVTGPTWSSPSLARPSGNLTGVNFFGAELAAKRLELLRELIPAAARIAVLVNPANAEADSTLRDVEAAARDMHRSGS